MNFNEQIESLFEEYRRQRENLTEMQRSMRALSATSTSPRREVSVTVGQNGVLTDVRFPTGAHKRLTPADLTAIIMAAYGEAKEIVMEQAADLLAPMLPDGVDAGSLVRGNGGADAFLPSEPRMAASVRETLGMGKPE